MSKVQYITVTDHHQGQRLDNFLLRHLKGVPKSHLYRIIRKGEVRVNKKRCDVSDKLHAGDEIRIPPIRLEVSANQVKKLSLNQIQMMEKIILFENDDFLVINKPHGLAVHGGSGIASALIEMLRLYKPEYKHAELVHRLDRDTSGCMLVAKKMSTLRTFHELFRDGKITKIYTALVKGYWPAKLKHIDVSLHKYTLPNGERMVKVDKSGKEAATSFRVLKRFDDTTLLSAELHTGRTHQIRVHTKYAGHPIVGDTKYGDEGFNKKLATSGLKRLCLHATKLSFVWPENGKEYTFEVPVPKEFLQEGIL